jgi:hypothetical protein
MVAVAVRHVDKFLKITMFNTTFSVHIGGDML